MPRGKFGCLEKGLKDVTILILGLPLPRGDSCSEVDIYLFSCTSFWYSNRKRNLFNLLAHSSRKGGTHCLTIQTYERTLVLRFGSIVSQIEKGTPLNFENNLTQIPY